MPSDALQLANSLTASVLIVTRLDLVYTTKKENYEKYNVEGIKILQTCIEENCNINIVRFVVFFVF